ncbi:MAG: cytochrome-c peroxidase [Saprospiraceae bacterium]|nr:cytochrome-c peroxidase [Saprospiraceae bacterium]
MKKYYKLIVGLFVIALLHSCKHDDSVSDVYELNLPAHFSEMPIPADNPLTKSGVALGRKLFYDPILSGDSTQSCSSCHNIEFGMTDHGKQFSKGIDSLDGNRNAMTLVNLGYDRSFFWDGRASSLEQQVLMPIQNPIEMHETLPNVVRKLNANSAYVSLFKNAFNTTDITSQHVAKALAQFMRALVSYESYFDKNYNTTDKILAAVNNPQNSIERGMLIFFGKGECFHCHGNYGNYLFTDFDLHNNGLDSIPTDIGYEAVTANVMDRARFKTPTLRNLAFTAPYMHDGRFPTLDMVFGHYFGGVKNSTTLDPNMELLKRGVPMSATDFVDLKAFLLSLSDSTYLYKEEFQNPN